MAILSSRGAALIFAASLLACSSDEAPGGTSPDPTTGGGGGGSTSSTTTGTGGSAPEEWVTLIDGTWELPPSTEGYWCTLKTIEKDTYIKAYRGLAPTGTHHTLLLHADGNQPDGEYACGATLGSDLVFASGIGTDDFAFPEGVALKIQAGTQLLLNLHLFNTSGRPMGGVSGTLVKVLDASEVESEAEMILPGAFSIHVPPNGKQTVRGSCEFPAESRVLSVWPHMHQYGVHSRVVLARSSGNQVLHDAPYSFNSQKNYAIDAVRVGGGERVEFACSYQNPTSAPITFGDSSDAEMCFVGIYRYPKLSSACQ
jgi:hypothetical protein